MLMTLVSLGSMRDALAGEVFHDSFNSGNIGDRYIRHGGCYSYSFTRSNGALRVTNKMGEDNRNCSNRWGKPKSHKGKKYYTRQVELLPRASSFRPVYKEEYEHRFNIKFSKKSPTEVVFFQVISYPWKGFDIGLRYYKDHLWLHIHKQGRKKLIKVETGKWMEFTIRFKRSLNADGYVQFLVDNDLILNYKGPTTQSSRNGSGTMAKYGIYNGSYHNGSDRTTWEVFFDNYRVERY